jgi:stage V sporulation protein B
LGFAKLYFLLAAYATVGVLSRLLDEATFGDYSVVARLIAVPNMVIIYSLMFTVSRPMAAEFEEGSPSYYRLRARGFKMALVLGGVTSAVFFLGAPFFAASLAEDSLTWPIRVVAPISLVYALYAVNVGTLNARRIFSRQAALDVFMATSKAGLIIAVAAMGFGLAPTLAGFTGASLLAFLLSIVLVGAARPKTTPSEAKQDAPMAGLAGILVVYTFATTLLLSVDLFVLKHFATTEATKTAVGFYSGAQYVAQVPYSLLNAISLLVFPLIATLHAQGDKDKVRAYITSTAAVVLLLLALMSSVAVGAAPEILNLLFKPTYVDNASNDMRYMVVGYSGYSFAVTSGWIFNSARRSRWAIALVTSGLICSFAGGMLWVPTMGSAGAAQAVAIAGGVALLVSLFALWKVFGVSLSPLYMVKLALVAGVVAFAGLAWPVDGKIMGLVKLTALTLLFGAGAIGLKLVTVEQIKGLRRAA